MLHRQGAYSTYRVATSGKKAGRMLAFGSKALLPMHCCGCNPHDMVQSKSVHTKGDVVHGALHCIDHRHTLQAQANPSHNMITNRV